MSDSLISNLNSLRPNNSAASLLKSGSQKKDQTSLLETAAQRQSDKLEFTQVMLKRRLEQDLDSTLASHEAENPSIKGQYFIAIMDDHTVEVVDKKAFLSQVEDEEAKAAFEAEPVGFFKRQNFPLKTSTEPSYQFFKTKLDQYFQRNAEVIQYLRNNPDIGSDLSGLYKTPPT